MRARAAECLADVAAAHPGESVVLASHGGLVHSALLECTGLPAEQISHVGNCSITTLARVPGGWTALAIGEDAHVTAGKRRDGGNADLGGR